MQENKNIQEIKEDILIVGAGLIGGLVAHAFSHICGYTVRVIDRLPNMTTENNWHDRSSVVSVSYRSQMAYEKFGLGKEYKEIANFYKRTSINFGDLRIDIPQTLQNQFVTFCTISRRDFTRVTSRKNEENKDVQVEYDTKVVNIDLDNKTIETQKEGENVQKRRFKLIIGCDGYNSLVRQSMDKKIIRERNLPEDTVLSRVEYFPVYNKNVFIPNKEEFDNMQDDVKAGKYPWYDKLDDKFKQRGEQDYGVFNLDSEDFQMYGEQFTNGFMVPLDKKGHHVCVMGIHKNRENLEKFCEQHREFQNSIRLNKDQFYSLEDLESDEQVHEFLAKHYPKYYGFCPNMVELFKETPAFRSQTVYCDNWFYKGEVCLFGDACTGASWVSGNGHNVSMETLSRYFSIMEEELKGDFGRFLKDEQVRENVFRKYQEECFEDARSVQDGDIKDVVFPSLVQAQHQKSMLYLQAEAQLYERIPQIYNNKPNLLFYSSDSFQQCQGKVRVFSEYLIEKIKDVESIEEVDLSNCEQELTELLKENKLSVEHKMHPRAIVTDQF